MSNELRLIYVLVYWVFHNVHIRHFVGLKKWFLIIRQRVLLNQWFRYTCVGIRNILKDHLFLNINSDCYSNNKRIPLLMCCISLSNDESLIYVLDSWVFHNVHFRHFGWLKMRFLIIRQRVLLSQSFWMHFCWD